VSVFRQQCFSDVRTASIIQRCSPLVIIFNIVSIAWQRPCSLLERPTCGYEIRCWFINLSFPSHRSTWSSSLIVLSHPSLSSQIFLSFRSCFVQQSTIQVENLSLSVFLSSLVCIHLGYLRISPVLTKLRFFISQTFHYYSPSFHSCQILFHLTCKCLWISSYKLFQHFKA